MMPPQNRWNKFWFAPADAATLGFCRVILMLGAFLYYRGTNFESWGYVPHEFWQPIWLFQHAHWAPLAPGAMEILGIIWKTFLLLGAIGVFTRTSCFAAFALGLYLVGLPNNIGKVDHNDAIVLWGFLVMAIARSGDAWSIDQLIRTARGVPDTHDAPDAPDAGSEVPRRPGSVPPREEPASSEYLRPGVSSASNTHPEYRWPLRLMQVLMAVIFCIAGTTKLRVSGLSWAFSDNLRNTFLMEQYLSRPTLNWGLWIAAHPALCHFLALMSLVMEVGMPLALFNRPARWIIVPSLMLMQMGNELLLGIKFRQFMLCYAFWVPWADVARTIRNQFSRDGSRSQKTAVLFDGSCGLCQRTMSILRRLDLLDRIEILDAMNHWSAISSRYPSLNQADCLSSMHVVDRRGRVTKGFFAYRTLAANVPIGWLILPILYVPGVPTIGQVVYQRIADRRYNQGCGIEERIGPRTG